jgi:outer membrane protein assembly factor BamB
MKILALSGLLACSWAQRAPVPEWGQWGGPERNFQVPATPIAAQWPAGGPKVLWKRSLPFGSSSIAVDGVRLFTMYRDGENEVVLALDGATGKTVWEYRYPAAFLKGMNMNTGPGPHATPLVVGDRLFTAGVTGKFHCLDKNTGKLLWMRGLIEEMGGSVMLRGYSNSPLRYGKNVIVMVGGAGHTIVALDLETGVTRWQGGDFRNSHSSPVFINVDGENQVACVVEKAVAGFDPESGRVLWSHPHENRGGDITSTLLWGADNLLFFSGAYQGGSRVLELHRTDGTTSIRELWFHRQLRVHHSNAMRIGEYVYASNGDFGGTIFECVDIRNGEIKWRERAIPRANTLLFGSRALILDEDGVLHLGTLSPEGWREASRFQALENLAWTPPSVGGTILYLRDRKSIMALDLR